MPSEPLTGVYNLHHERPRDPLKKWNILVWANDGKKFWQNFFPSLAQTRMFHFFKGSRGRSWCRLYTPVKGSEGISRMGGPGPPGKKELQILGKDHHRDTEARRCARLIRVGRRASAFGGGGREAARRGGPTSGRPRGRVVLKSVPLYACGLFSVSLWLCGF